jgi:hypothetical protein
VLDPEFNASAACRDLMYQLTYFTLSRADPFFIHQVAVDAYAAQHAGPRTKPISIAFALVGLYLVIERGFTGRQAQRAHMELARREKQWPRFQCPEASSVLTVRDPILVPDAEKEEAILRWGRAVWESWKGEEERITGLLETYLGLS